MDKRQAGVTDDLSASINYGEVSHMITDFTRKHTFKLLRSSLLITGSVDFLKQRDAGLRLYLIILLLSLMESLIRMNF